MKRASKWPCLSQTYTGDGQQPATYVHSMPLGLHGWLTLGGVAGQPFGSGFSGQLASLICAALLAGGDALPSACTGAAASVGGGGGGVTVEVVDGSGTRGAGAEERDDRE